MPDMDIFGILMTFRGYFLFCSFIAAEFLIRVLLSTQFENKP